MLQLQVFFQFIFISFVASLSCCYCKLAYFVLFLKIFKRSSALRVCEHSALNGFVNVLHGCVDDPILHLHKMGCS